MFKVRLNQLECYAYHGVPAEEKVVGHRYSIDLELTVDGKADETDQVGDTVDYGLLGSEVVTLVTATQFNTIEKLARHIAEAVLASHRLVVVALVRVSKLLPPAPFIAASASAEVRVERIRGLES